MKSILPALMRLLSGRVARNLYFWLWLIYLRAEYAYTPLKAMVTASLFLVLGLLFYTNNLVLLPRLLSKKKYVRYAIVYAGLVLVVAILYTGILKWMIHFHPDVRSWMVSPLLQNTETPSLTFVSLLRESLSYCLPLAVAGAVFALSWYITSYQELQQKVAALRQRQLQLELSLLRSQVNPHFLFNTLNNLYALTLQHSEKAPRAIEELCIIMRYLLDEAGAETISAEKEQEIMQAYIGLELLRLNSTTGLHFIIEADNHYQIPPLLWLPVLENIFKHGTQYITAQQEAAFTFSIAAHELSISSRNRCRPAAHDSGHGTGLANLRKRLQLLYPGRHQLRTVQEGAYFLTDLKIQLSL